MKPFWELYFAFQRDWEWIALMVLISPFILGIGVNHLSHAAWALSCLYIVVLVIWREIHDYKKYRKVNNENARLS